MKHRFLLTLVLAVAFAGHMTAQTTGTVGGKVVDENGEPVIGAQIQVKGSKSGTVTDVDGNFTLPTAKRGDIIVINFLGMGTQTLKAAPNMKISLQPELSLIHI